MTHRNRPLLLLTCALACVSSPPNPKPSHDPVPVPARREIARDAPPAPPAIVAPGSVLAAASPQGGPRTFSSGVAVDQALFDFVVPQAGRWALCVSGQKRAGEVFGFYRVLVKDKDHEENLPRFKGAPRDAAKFGPECLRDEAGEPELRAGARVRLRSMAATAGELVLNLTAERM